MAIVLDATTKSLEIVLAGAITTNQLPFSAYYADKTATTFTAGSNDGATNNTTAVTVVAAPAASTQRLISNVTIYNADTAQATVTVQLNNNATTRILHKVTLDAGDQLVYETSAGWQVLDSSGKLKSTGSGGGSSLPSGSSGETLRHDGTNWVTASNLFNDGTFIGVNASTPVGVMEVKHASGNADFRFLADATGDYPLLAVSSSGAKAMGLQTGTNGTAILFDDAGFFNIAKEANASILDGTSGGGTTIVRVNNNGTVGFNTDSPALIVDIRVTGTDGLRVGQKAAGAANAPVIELYHYNNYGFRWRLDDTYADIHLDKNVAGTYTSDIITVKNATGRIGFNQASPAGQAHIAQSSASGAIPVVVLEQVDVSEEFTRYIGSAAAGVLTQSIVNASDVTTATLAGYVKVYVQDDGNQITDQAYYQPLYTLA
jgi:hypothetical protein